MGINEVVCSLIMGCGFAFIIGFAFGIYYGRCYQASIDDLNMADVKKED